MQTEWILEIGKYLTQLGIIVGTLSKLLDLKLKPIVNRDRIALRYHIVAFASDLHNGIKKTRDEYLSIFEQITEYNQICQDLGIKNHLFTQECEYIDKCYKELG